MYNICKYSSSGIWNGQSYKKCKSFKDAVEWLKRLERERIRQGYDVSREIDGRNQVVGLEVNHDMMADSGFYIIEKDSK
jgi:hypothetical protein